MTEHTVKEYNMEDYKKQEKEINNMPYKELADFISYVARAYISDYNYTFSELDFYNHKEQMMMYRVENILRALDDIVAKSKEN